ncbi:xanthotoxin 5-hydroxylase CYP82C4-like [Aristolochia californica]|uniref:xanthotoxin 5-hydroxylase CYP82C4-like n=1 Tax=Aristolochia californica TaxID=171875 RepID=UPI0035DA9E44
MLWPAVPAELLGYNYAMFGFTPYGPYWREIRKIATLELLSNRRLELLKHVPASEVDSRLKFLYTQWVKNDQLPIKVEMKEWFGNLMFNNVVMMIAGKRYFGSDDVARGEGGEGVQAVHAGLVLPDGAGHERVMKRTAAEMNVVVSRWMAEHREKRSSGVAAREADFIDMLLSTLEDVKITTYDSDTIIKATSLGLGKDICDLIFTRKEGNLKRLVMDTNKMIINVDILGSKMHHRIHR